MPLTPMEGTETPPELVEEDVEIELEATEEDEAEIVNPNVEAQLDSASEEGVSDAPEQTAQEKYDAFMKDNPDAREIHGKSTEKRIGKLTWEKNEAERLSTEAVEHAQRMTTENTKLQKNRTDQDGAFINEHKNRITSELTEATRDYQQSVNLNDAEGMAKGTAAIARLSQQLELANQTETRFNRAQEEAPEVPVTVPQPTAAPPAAPAPRPPVNPKAEAWATENEWFGEDEELTKAALTVHKQLITQEGVVVNSEKYYTELNERMASNFPSNEYFKKDNDEATSPQLETPSALVTPGSGGGGGPRKAAKVKLTAAQVQLAKRLGVPLPEYAKSLAEYNKQA
jgi:hypothetical protein